MPPGLGPVVQIILGCCCASVLAYKCYHDKSGRGVVRFCFDSSKNFGGAFWMHIANLLVAGVLGSWQSGRGGSEETDPCQWYWIEIMMDTTLGVFVEYKLLEALLIQLREMGDTGRHLAEKIEAPCISMPAAPVADAEEDAEAAKPAEAGAPGSTAPAKALLSKTSMVKAPDTNKIMQELSTVWKKLDKAGYAMQMLSWLGVVTAMKFVMVILMLALSPQLEFLSRVALGWLTDPDMKLVLVMIITPCCMNAVQFWLQDNIFVDVAKWHEKKEAAAAQALSDERYYPKGIETLDDTIQKETDKSNAKKEEVKKQGGAAADVIEAMENIQSTQDEKYKKLEKNFNEVCQELSRRVDGSFFNEILRGKASQAYPIPFTVTCKQTNAGQYVAICGEGEMLGEWNVDKALRLKVKKWPTWESEPIRLDRNRAIQYKFLIKDENGEVRLHPLHARPRLDCLHGC